ncbi:MAG: BMC domain-containing protein [Lachnospiraceae bacterium]|nr:BMC domain-containing protein [Lachnospiraceae bacterium]MDE7021520.1 BMC domain-containing protein [Lachnospiraceae bacterium]
MGKAYGFIEITGVVAAMDALDIMCKAANVELATWERKLGGRLVTLVIEGDVSAVRQAVEAGSTQALKKPAATGVLPNPHPEIVRMVELSASRFKGKTEPSSGSKMLGEDPPDFVPKDQNEKI